MKVTRDWISSAHVGRFAAALAVAFAVTSVPATALAKSDVKLLVDAGHGGKDPGAVSGGMLEKEVNLQITREVVKAAKRQGWKVKTTRNSDKFVSLNERPRKANAWKADALVSIHGNSMGKKPRGHMTIYRGGASKRLGQKIMNELKPLTSYGDIGNKRDVRGLAVLRGARTPAVIVEALSVSSPAERKVLKSASARREIAEAIVRGVAKNENVKYVPPAKPKPKKAAKPKKAVAEKPAKAAKVGAKPKATDSAAEKRPAPKVESAKPAAEQTKPAEQATPTEQVTPTAPASSAPETKVERAPEAEPAMAKQATPEPGGLLGRLLKLLGA